MSGGSPTAATPQALRTLDRGFGRWVADTFAADAPAGQRDTCCTPGLRGQFRAAPQAQLPGSRQGRPAGRGELEQLLQPLPAATGAGCRRTWWPCRLKKARPRPRHWLRSSDGRRRGCRSITCSSAPWRSTCAAWRRSPCAGPERRATGTTRAILFPRPTGARNAGQFEATRIALTHRFAVITGGPGTGKTWTVARIIALLQLAEPGLRIALAAPTGKAANRMMESLRAATVVRREPCTCPGPGLDPALAAGHPPPLAQARAPAQPAGAGRADRG